MIEYKSKAKTNTYYMIYIVIVSSDILLLHGQVIFTAYDIQIMENKTISWIKCDVCYADKPQINYQRKKYSINMKMSYKSESSI